VAEYFIHPEGNDGWAGSLAAPFATVQHGVDVATTPGDIVSIIHDPAASNPIHPISTVITCNSSGTPSAPITIRGVDVAGNPRPTTRPRVDVTTTSNAHFTGTGLYLVFEDMDLGNYNSYLFHTLRSAVIRRVRQVNGSASGIEVFGINFTYSCTNCIFEDCEQFVSRVNYFNSDDNTAGSNIYLRCYSVKGFSATGERKAPQFIRCIADGATVGFNAVLTSYLSVGASLYGCVAIGCGTGVKFQNGNVSASNLSIINSTGNAVELLETGTNNGCVLLQDSIIVGSGGYGIYFANTNRQNLREARNWFYNNTSGDISSGSIDSTSHTGTDPGLSETTLRIEPNSPAANLATSLHGYETAVSAGAFHGAYPCPADIAAAVWARTGRTLTS
jgi:hypothetical protein